MTTITFNSTPVHTSGTLPEVGSPAPEFTLVGSDLQGIHLSDFDGKRVILSVFPSLDTGVCAQSVRRFNALAAGMSNTVVLCVSKDLPFAQERFCVSEGIKNVVNASAFRSTFGEDYGVTMTDGPLTGLLSRAIIVIDADGKVAYAQQVPEITTEPDYDAAIAAPAD